MEQPVQHIYKETLRCTYLKYRGLWIFLIVATISTALVLTLQLHLRVVALTPLLFIPFILSIVLLAIEQERVRDAFFSELAHTYNFVPLKRKELRTYTSFPVHKSHVRNIRRYIYGILHDLPTSFFEYVYTVGSGKHKTTYRYSVLQSTLPVHVPHILVLDTNHMFTFSSEFYGARLTPPLVRKITLEGNFSTHRNVFVEKEHEIEAYELLTPDIMEYILHNFDNIHIELTDNNMFLYTSREIYTKEGVDTLFELHGKLHTRISRSISSIQKH